MSITDMKKQTKEKSWMERKSWVELIWNIDKKKFPLSHYRIRFGEDPEKDSVVWKQQKVAYILRKHNNDRIRAANKDQNSEASPLFSAIDNVVKP